MPVAVTCALHDDARSSISTAHQQRQLTAKRSARPYQTHNRRDPGFSRSPKLGPFDAYVLDGSRYIRVEGKDSYALVDTVTGKVTWIAKAGRHQAYVPNTAGRIGTGYPETGKSY